MINAQNDYAVEEFCEPVEGFCIEKGEGSAGRRFLYQIAFIESALDDPEHISLDGYEEELCGKLDRMTGDGKVGALRGQRKSGF